MVPVDFLRSLSNQFLPDTATIQRYTETVSGDGTSQSWSDVATGVACRVSPLASGANEILGADQALKDRIVVGTRTFEVNRVGERSYETVRECICREVT
jgi:hypothetical protein